MATRKPRMGWELDDAEQAKASEIEHAIHSHIRKHVDENSVLYRKLSERLNAIVPTLSRQLS